MSYKRNITENKCENCKFAKDYSGWDEHYCEARHCVKRAEEYNCKDFKPGIYVDDSQGYTELWEENN